MTSPDDLAAAIADPEGEPLRSAAPPRLRELAAALVAESDRLAATGRPGEALAAAVAAAAAYRVLLERDPVPTPGEADAGYLSALTRQVSLLVATGRLADLPRLTEAMAGAERLMNARAERSLQAAEQQLASVDRWFHAAVGAGAAEDLAATARALLDAGRVTDAEAAAERLLAQREALLPPPDQPLWSVVAGDLLPALDLLARVRTERGDIPGARAALDRSLATVEAIGHPAELRRELQRRAEALARLGDWPAAGEALTRALRAGGAEPAGPGELTRRELLARLGALRARLGDRNGAVSAYREAVAACPAGDPELLGYLAPLAALLRAEGDLAAAREALERALEVDEQINRRLAREQPAREREALERESEQIDTPLRPPPEWVSRELLGVVAAHGDRPATAATVERLLDRYAPHVGLADRELELTLDRLVDRLLDNGDPATAVAAQERIVEILAAPEAYGPAHATVLAALRRLAELQQAQGAPAAAVTTLRRLLAATRHRHGERSEPAAAVLLRLASARVAAGDLTGALPDLQQGLAVMTRLRGEHHPATASYATDAAMLVYAAGDLARARTLLEMAAAMVEAAGGDDTRARDRLADLAAEPSEPSEPQSAIATDPEWPAVDPDRLAPDWVDGVDLDELLTLAERLGQLADEREQAGRTELALPAAAESVRAERRILELSGAPAGPEGWRAVAVRFGQWRRLLAVTGRRVEHWLAGLELEPVRRRFQEWRAGLPEPARLGPAHAAALHAMAETLSGYGHRGPARAAWEHELAVREVVHGPDSAEVAARLRSLALGSYLDDLPAMRGALERAARILAELDGGETVPHWTVLGDLAMVLREDNDLPALRSVLERRARISAALHGPESTIARGDRAAALAARRRPG